MNAIFGIKMQITVGEQVIIGLMVSQYIDKYSEIYICEYLALMKALSRNMNQSLGCGGDLGPIKTFSLTG